MDERKLIAKYTNLYATIEPNSLSYPNSCIVESGYIYMCNIY